MQEIFRFHPLLVEDTFADATTPKIDSFDGYLYIIVHGLTEEGTEVAREEVHTMDLDLFLGKNYLITHYREHFAAVEETLKAVKREPRLLARGPAVVCHRVIDRLVDEFLPLMEKLDAEIDAIQTAIMKSPHPSLLERIFRMQHSLQRIRRIGHHQKTLLSRLSRGEFALIPEDTRPFFSDVYDHFLRVTDLTDVYREQIASSMEGYISVQSHKLNEIMRVLTIFSTVMLPLNFIAGLYGMNFDYMPGLHWDYGYQTAVSVMVTLAIGLWLFFKSRRWV
ncbi:MAG: magnesium/cobalt transporter CorA [Sandaracinaceae bacterium]|nr:magnesium/cobalt transporter CorA [Sandaracinaceae bacterium]